MLIKYLFQVCSRSLYTDAQEGTAICCGKIVIGVVTFTLCHLSLVAMGGDSQWGHESLHQILDRHIYTFNYC